MTDELSEKSAVGGQSPLFIKTEAFMLWMFQHTEKFPKSERFRIAKRIDDYLLDFYEALISATKSNQTMQWLKQADIKLTLLRSMLRISVEMRYLSFDQYAYCSKQVTEIGKLLGGWMKKA